MKANIIAAVGGKQRNLEEWEDAEYFEGDCLDSSDLTWGFSKYVRRKF